MVSADTELCAFPEAALAVGDARSSPAQMQPTATTLPHPMRMYQRQRAGWGERREERAQGPRHTLTRQSAARHAEKAAVVYLRRAMCM